MGFAAVRELGCGAQSVDMRSAMTAALSLRYSRASGGNERSLFKIRTGSSELSSCGHLMPHILTAHRDRVKSVNNSRNSVKPRASENTHAGTQS
jgi:hypothetical protein